MPRNRKAWSISVKGAKGLDVVFAPSASKARAQVIDTLRDAWGLTFREALEHVGAATRWHTRDVSLPDRHPLAAQLPADVLHCVVHAYGGTGERAGYRDHFYTNAGDKTMLGALYHGLFEVARVDPRLFGLRDMVMYVLTDLGRNVASGEVETYPRGY